MAAAHQQGAPVPGQLQDRCIVGAELTGGGLDGLADQVVQRRPRQGALAELDHGGLLMRPSAHLVPVAMSSAPKHFPVT